MLEVDRDLARGADPGGRDRARGSSSSSREHGLTLRHFPQSFEFSTLGGWIATRAGGHFATLYTHIDDLVESVRALTPAGVWESRRLPGSGAGVSPDRLLLGSEGTLGVITEAWVRVRATAALPRLGRRAVPGLPDRRAGRPRAVPVRPLPVQLPPDRPGRGGADRRRRRLRGAARARLRVAGPRGRALLALALECCGDHGGRWERARGEAPTTAVGSWREAFLRAPYLRDTFVAIGRAVGDVRDRDHVGPVRRAARGGARARRDRGPRQSCGAGSVTCRFTHVYPDGPAPYLHRAGAGRAAARSSSSGRRSSAAASDAVLAARRHDHPPPRGRARPPAVV